MKNVKLQAARIESGQTQKQVASTVGIPEQAYQRYEYGKREPGVRTAIRIAKALNKDTGDMDTLFSKTSPISQ